MQAKTMNQHVRMARIYIREAHATRWPHWRAQLLEYAANRRAKFYAEIREARRPKQEPGQLDMFV